MYEMPISTAMPSTMRYFRCNQAHARGLYMSNAAAWLTCTKQQCTKPSKTFRQPCVNQGYTGSTLCYSPQIICQPPFISLHFWPCDIVALPCRTCSMLWQGSPSCQECCSRGTHTGRVLISWRASSRGRMYWKSYPGHRHETALLSVLGGYERAVL